MYLLPSKLGQLLFYSSLQWESYSNEVLKNLHPLLYLLRLFQGRGGEGGGVKEEEEKEEEEEKKEEEANAHFAAERHDAG